MTVVLIICAIFCLFGLVLGKKLAALGISPDKSLDNHQGCLLVIFSTIAILFAVLLILDHYNLAYWLPKIFPAPILLYLGAYYHDLILIVGCFSLGLLVSLELFSKSTFKQKIELSVAVGTITCALAILLYYLLPIDELVKQPKIINGVVFQTTPYTCAPSSIATLGRWFGDRPHLLEADVIKLAGTNLFGTTTLAEMQTLEQLGLKPQYQHNLTLEQLMAFRKPGLLHVKERYNGQYTSHTVALLGIDPQQQLVLIGNPLYGQQVKTAQQMQGYWFGEAILIN
jgi:hypothetical protein